MIVENPDSLDDSPYDPEVISILKEIFAPVEVEKVVERVIEKAARGRPTKDAQLSSEDLKKLKDGIDDEIDNLDTLWAEDGVDTGQKIQIAKTRTSLRDQLLKMQERVTNIMQTQLFIETIVGVAEELLDEAGREEFMKRVDQYR